MRETKRNRERDSLSAFLISCAWAWRGDARDIYCNAISFQHNERTNERERKEKEGKIRERASKRKETNMHASKGSDGEPNRENERWRAVAKEVFHSLCVYVLVERNDYYWFSFFFLFFNRYIRGSLNWKKNAFLPKPFIYPFLFFIIRFFYFKEILTVNSRFLRSFFICWYYKTK